MALSIGRNVIREPEVMFSSVMSLPVWKRDMQIGGNVCSACRWFQEKLGFSRKEVNFLHVSSLPFVNWDSPRQKWRFPMWYRVWSLTKIFKPEVTTFAKIWLPVEVFTDKVEFPKILACFHPVSWIFDFAELKKTISFRQHGGLAKSGVQNACNNETMKANHE